MLGIRSNCQRDNVMLEHVEKELVNVEKKMQAT